MADENTAIQQYKFPVGTDIKINVPEETLAEIERTYATLPDLSTSEGYEQAMEGIKTCRTLRSRIESWRKETKGNALKFCQTVDGLARKARTRILAVEGPMKEAKVAKDEEEVRRKQEAERKERERVEAIEARINKIAAAPDQAIMRDPAGVQVLIDGLKAVPDSSEWAAEFAEKAKDVIKDSLKKLAEIKSLKLAQEKIETEKEALRAKAEADRLKAEAEAAELRKVIAEKEAAEREKARIEKKKALLEIEKAERAKREKARIEKEKTLREAEEKARREAEENIVKLTDKTIDTLVPFCKSKTQATLLLTAIKDDKIPGMSWNPETIR